VARRPLPAFLRIGLPLFGAAYYFYLRPQMLKAGTRSGEALRELPGDELIPAPNFQVTRAIDINAPPEMVWPWVAQLGRDGSGFYGLDSLTNQGVPSVAYLRQDLPVPQAGSALDAGYRLLSVEPDHFLIYGAFDLPTLLGETMERTTLILLEPAASHGTRLLVRTRGYTYSALGPLYNLFYEVFDYFQSMAQLDNIRQRAETMARLQRS
jgi:hypothetical protein